MSDDTLMHYGILRKSGRYPWGSGANPNQRNRSFLATVDAMKKQGLSEKQICDGLGITTTQLRAARAIAKNAERRANMDMALRLKEKGMSNVAIGERMGINESSVRSLLDPGLAAKADVLQNVADMLERQVAEKGIIDIGSGVESGIGISPDKLKVAVQMLHEKDYQTMYVKVQQLGTGKQTTVKVLVPPGMSYSEVYKNRDNIRQIQEYSEDGGRTLLGIEPPAPVSSKRVAVRYAEEGGADADGVIYIRPGVKDIALGSSRYAQVRIAVDGTHYLKGMAMYKDDLPDGVDIMFNTNKSNTGNKLDAMKPLKQDKATGEIDADNPFGAVIRQQHYTDSSGKRQLSAINIVNEEGNWNDWSRTLSSQMLSKQDPKLARKQLQMLGDVKQQQLDEILALNNPAVKKRLLQSMADDLDSSAVHLKAAALPRQRTQVILPINSLKDTEIYAPNFRDGEKVVLVRYPHGGIFEIPELTVNNRHAPAKRALGNAIDAVGINSKVAARLSGADFDGDSVLVIPNNSRAIRTSKPLDGLKGFDPQAAYPGYPGMKVMSAKTKALKMGDVSNLITDMTIRGASHDELARAVRHSMVVIDAEKHKLNYRQSYIDNGIADLKRQYQDGARSGASTLISRASGEQRVDDRKARSAKDGGAIDIATGKKMYQPTGATYVNKQGQRVPVRIKSTKMQETDDAFSLSSGTVMETVYASHANRLKEMANQARREMVAVRTTPYSPSAKATYSKEVASLDAKLARAIKNRPLERQAQIIANATVSQKRQANPNMDAAELKKIKGQALQEARARVGAKKIPVDITPSEWNAIQSGAISTNKLDQILSNTDLDHVKKLATPRDNPVMNTARMALAKSMLASGYTQAEVSDALGIPTSTLNDALLRKES